MMRRELYLNDISGPISFGSHPCWLLNESFEALVQHSLYHGQRELCCVLEEFAAGTLGRWVASDDLYGTLSKCDTGHFLQVRVQGRKGH